jgi:multidrug resistance efflux pump/GAF domain-containing protein
VTQAPTQTERGPRGWERLVAQLNASPDLPTFNRAMLDLQCKIVAAAHGALWAMDEQGKPRLIETWPQPIAQAASNGPLMKVLEESAVMGFEKQQNHILKAEPEGSTPDGQDLGAHVFVTVMRVRNQVAAVATVLAECRDPSVLQTTAPLRDLAAGLYEGFYNKQDLLRREADAQRVRQAMALLAISQEADGFHGACLNLSNELARQLGCTRVSIGWIKGQRVHLVGMSDTEQLKRHSPEVAITELAMSECLDQQQPVVYPVPADAEPLLQQAVVHAHRRITNDVPGRFVISLPMRFRDEWIGVLTLERTDKPFDTALIQYLQLITDVIAPHLADRKRGDRWLYVHAWDSVKWAGAYLVGSKHTAWKLGGVALTVLIMWVFLGHLDYNVTAPAVLESYSKRILPAPFDARIQDVKVLPGDKVESGQLLAELDSSELVLQRAESLSRMNRAQKERDQNMAQAKIAEGQQAQATMDEMKAQIDLLDYQISHSKITAPIAGVVITGAWKDKIGGVIKQGDQMFEVAPLNDLVAVIHVAETDIAEIIPGHTVKATLAPKSQPEDTFDLEITRVVPNGTPVNQINSFELRANINSPQDWLKPGMEGRVKIEVGPKRVIWIVSHRIIDTVRLWLWW